jgi:NTE family protein
VDGGLLDNLPVDVVKAMGADTVIAVDVGYPLGGKPGLQSAIAVMEQSMALLGLERRKENSKLIDVLIQPDLTGFSMADFPAGRIRRIIQAGDQAARLNRVALSGLGSSKETLNGRVAARSHPSGERLRIGKIAILGNRFLPSAFVSRLLGLQEGDLVDSGDVSRRLQEMYGYGYFESLAYDLDSLGAGDVRFTLSVKESPLRKLRLGIRYDELHKLVGAAALQLNSVLVPGMRIDNELQFAGLVRWKTKAFYPSLNLTMPAYPFMEANFQDVPTHLFNQDGEQIAQYKHRSADAGIGLGFLAGKLFNMEIAYRYERVDIHPDIALPDPVLGLYAQDNLQTVRAALDVDALDDVFIPRRGISLKAAVEKSLSALGTDVPYTLLDVSADWYRTFSTRHTFRGYGFGCHGSSRTPVYKYYNRGRPEFFIGMQYDQLISSRMGILRLEYRYQHKKDIFVKAMVNTAFGFGHIFPAFEHHENWLWGAGIGVTFLSPVGPIDIAYGRGSRSYSRHREGQDVLYFSMGFKF